MNRMRKIVLYGIYALVALAVFLYFRFPSELMREILLSQVQEIDPQARLDTDLISPTVPPGIELEPFSVSYANTPILRMDGLKITPQLSSLIGHSRRFEFKGTLGSGELNGLAIRTMTPNEEQVQVNINLSRVPLEFLEVLNQYQSFRPDGELDARINFDSIKGGGTAEVNMEISQARITLDPPLMGLEAMEFSLIKAQLTISPRMVQIRSCEASGDQLESKLTGSILFRHPLENSRLTLSLTIKPQPSFLADHKNDMIGGLLASGNAQKRGLIFRISGTLNNPNYVVR